VGKDWNYSFIPQVQVIDFEIPLIDIVLDLSFILRGLGSFEHRGFPHLNGKKSNPIITLLMLTH
jgi:hypothetical protein